VRAGAACDATTARSMMEPRARASAPGWHGGERRRRRQRAAEARPRRGMGCSLVFVAVVASVLQVLRCLSCVRRVLADPGGPGRHSGVSAQARCAERMPPVVWQVMGEGRSSEEVSIARENVIIPSPRVAYHVGDESLDAVCTSLDGPLCKAEEKAHMLSMERARAARTAGHQQSEQKRGRNAGAKETVQVKTVKEFKFQGGKEVGGKVETQVKKGGGKERDSPLVILKQFAEGDDINDIVNQVQAGIADALKALEEGLDGDEDPGDEVSSQLRQLRQRGSDDEHRTTARRRLKDVRECDVPVVVDGAAGNHKSVPPRGHVGGSGAAPGVCRHKDALYRCTKIEGNALAPDAQQAAGRAGDSSASGSGGGGKEGGSGASGGCLTRQESAGECGGGEVLCQVSSPSSLAEFSSPQPCSFHYKPGFVPDDPRQDILIADMTWAQAIHTYMHACMHACMHTYIHTYIHTCMTLLPIRRGRRQYTRARARTHTRTYT
jgi:hypothetical protein